MEPKKKMKDEEKIMIEKIGEERERIISHLDSLVYTRREI